MLSVRNGTKIAHWQKKDVINSSSSIRGSETQPIFYIVGNLVIFFFKWNRLYIVSGIQRLKVYISFEVSCSSLKLIIILRIDTDSQFRTWRIIDSKKRNFWSNSFNYEWTIEPRVYNGIPSMFTVYTGIPERFLKPSPRNPNFLKVIPHRYEHLAITKFSVLSFFNMK